MDHLVKFKQERSVFKKRNLSITISQARTKHIDGELTKHYPFYSKLNKSEQIEFMLYVLENLMVHFGYPDFVRASELTLDKIHGLEGSK